MFKKFQEGFYLLQPKFKIEWNRRYEGYQKARINIFWVASLSRKRQLWVRFPKSVLVFKIENEIVGLV